MATLDFSDCSALTGWTSVDPGANATVDIVSGTLHYYKDQAAYGGSFNEVGVFRTSGTAGAVGHIIYVQFKVKGGAECMAFTLSKSGQVNYQNMVNAYFEGGNKISMWDGNTQRGNFAATGDTWYDLKFEIVALGAVNLSARASDTPGAFSPTSSAWTLVANGSTVTGYNSSTIFVASNMGSAVNSAADGCFLDEFYYTNNGNLQDPAGDSGSASLNIRRIRKLKKL